MADGRQQRKSDNKIEGVAGVTSETLCFPYIPTLLPVNIKSNCKLLLRIDGELPKFGVGVSTPSPRPVREEATLEYDRKNNPEASNP